MVGTSEAVSNAIKTIADNIASKHDRFKSLLLSVPLLKTEGTMGNNDASVSKDASLVERFDIEPSSHFFSQMIKVYRARSRLYRRQILQENIRWKALDEINEIYMLLRFWNPIEKLQKNCEKVLTKIF